MHFCPIVLYPKDRPAGLLTARVTISYLAFFYHIWYEDLMGSCLTRLISHTLGKKDPPADWGGYMSH